MPLRAFKDYEIALSIRDNLWDLPAMNYGIQVFKSNAQTTAEMPEEAITYGCTACHAIDKIVVGPAWADVAALYAQLANAREILIDKVKNGGRGIWSEVTGGVPMPPYSPRVPDQDIENLVDFILNIDISK